MGSNHNIREILIIYVLPTLLTVVLATVFIANKVQINRLKKEISQLTEKNKELNVNLMGLDSLINDKRLEIQTEELNFDPQEDLAWVLGLNSTNFESMTGLNIELEGVDMANRHLKELVQELPYISFHELERRNEKHESSFTAEGYGTFDLNFFLDPTAVEEELKVNPDKMEPILIELESKGVIGY